MANWTINGKSLRHDLMQQRIAAGTMGDSHMLPGGISGKAISSIIDDQDPRVLVGSVTGLGDGTVSLEIGRTTGFDSSGSYTYLSEYGSGIQLTFQGSSVGVIGRMSGNSAILGNLDGTIRVYVDGEEKRGKIPSWHQFNYDSYFAGTSGLISATETRLWVDDTYRFTVGKYVVVDDEVMQITAILNTETDRYGNPTGGDTGYIDVLRAQDGSIARQHNGATAIIYDWDSRFCLAPDTDYDYAYRRLLWYNPLLSPGPHKITVAVTNDLSVNTTYLHDGFLVGPLIGENQINIEYGTFTYTGTTDSNGVLYVPSISFPTGTTPISLIGVTQIAPDPLAGNFMMSPMFRPNYDAPSWEMVNGPASTSVTVQLIFAYISEAL